jgi:FecR protein
MSNRLFVVFISCASVLVSGAGHVRAQELISAKVISSEGQVEIRRQSSDQPKIQTIAFKVEDELSVGDTIITGRNGRLVLGLSDGSQAVIAPQTTVLIRDLSLSPRTLFNVIHGKTRIQIEKLGGRPNPYRVNTPTAVIAVRGTIFDVLVEEDETQVFVHEGEVAVNNKVLPDQQVFLFAGQMTRVLMERLPNLPGPFKPGRNNVIFKVGRNDRLFQGEVRIAAGRATPGSGRDDPPSNSKTNSVFGRVNSPPNGRRPNGGPEVASKKP